VGATGAGTAQTSLSSAQRSWAWLIDSLDREARRLGVTRQSVIKVWIAERLGRKVS